MNEPTRIFIGKIVTMDNNHPEAQAIAVQGEKVIAVGTREEIEKLAGPETERIELGSRVLYPGFIEPHMHIWGTAICYYWLDCGVIANKDLNAIKQRISDAAKVAQPGAWMLGKSFDPSLIPGNQDLTAQDLDILVPNNPALILNSSMHFAYANSKALEIAGLTKDTPDPEGGKFGRNADDTLNGILSELSAMQMVMQHIDKPSLSELSEIIATITHDAAKVGITAMREAGTGALLGQDEVSLLHQLRKADQLTTRISIALLDDVAKNWPKSPELAPMAGDDYVWIGARKFITDGSTQGKSAYLSTPYLHSNDRGKLNVDPATFKERVAWCHAHNWQIMAHANGDAAIDMVVQTYKEVISASPKKDLRHRIEHCSLVADDALFATMAEVGVTPSFLINHIYYWGDTLSDNILGADRMYMLDRANSALKAGLTFTMHSDYGVSPMSPLHYMHVAVNRMTQTGAIISPDQRVTINQALKAMTIDAAWQIHAESKIGSITPGKYADFVILESDPTLINPAEIDHIKISETWLGGKLTYTMS